MNLAPPFNVIRNSARNRVERDSLKQATIATLASVVILSACAGLPQVNQRVHVDGYVIRVTMLPDQSWAAMAVNRIDPTPDILRAMIQAVEQVSGCRVDRDTMIPSRRIPQMAALVTC